MLAHLLSENSCLVCGSEAPTTAQDYAERLENDRCVVCNTPLEKSIHIVETRDVADERVSKAERLLEAADRSLLAATHERERSESEFSNHTTEIAHLHAEVAKRAARLSEIIELLPPSEAALRKQRTELASVRGRLETMKAELAEERSNFHSFVEQCTDGLLSSSEEIVEVFATFAGNFYQRKSR